MTTDFALDSEQDEINEKTLRHLVGTRVPLHHDVVPFVLLWAQKAGCTSLASWFFWHVGVLDEVKAYKPKSQGLSVHLFENQKFKAAPGYRNELVRKILEGIPLINFVRCPYARAYSSFMHINNRHFLQFEQESISHNDLTLRKRILKDVFGSQVCIAEPLSFLQFLIWLKEQDMCTLNPHLRQQWTQLYTLPHVSHFRLEDMTFVSRLLERQYQLRDSRRVTQIHTGSHHLKKKKSGASQTLNQLAQGVPLDRTWRYEVPNVTRRILAGTEYGDLIDTIFSVDIAFYNQLSRYRWYYPRTAKILFQSFRHDRSAKERL